MSEEWTRRPQKRARQEEDGQHDDAEDDPTNTEQEPGVNSGWGERRDPTLAGGYAEYSAHPPPSIVLPHPQPSEPYPPPPATPGANPAAHPYPQPWQPAYVPPPPPPMGFPQMYPPFATPYNPYQTPPHIPPPYYPDPSMAMGVPPYGADVAPISGGHPQAGYPDGLAAEMQPAQVAPLPGNAERKDSIDDEEEDDQKPAADDGEIGSYGAASRLKMYVKPKVPTRQEILDRRARKNAQSRARAAKMRERIMVIKDRPEEERTEEENALLDQYESRRQRKNNRSRERAIEKKTEIDRILNKPERKRTKLEKQFLETALTAKQRKNEGDRLRRQRLKIMGKTRLGDEPGPSAKADGSSTATPAYGMPDIPVSPLPTNQTSYQSPGFASIAFPSPPNQRRPGHPSTPSDSETAGGAGAQGGSSQLALSFMPPSQNFDSAAPPAQSQLHLPQHSSQVEQRRHPDGSMTISIGGGRGVPPFGGEAPPSPELPSANSVNMSDMSQLLLYGDNGVDQNNVRQADDAANEE